MYTRYRRIVFDDNVPGFNREPHQLYACGYYMHYRNSCQISKQRAFGLLGFLRAKITGRRFRIDVMVKITDGENYFTHV